jgi:hypothetical protein
MKAQPTSPIEAFVMSLPGSIERSEKQGQQEVVENTLIPKDIGNGSLADLLRLGFTMVNEDADELFYEMRLPESWKLVADPEHSMYSYILDSTGAKRASLFYKAAFYDRRADLSFLVRYQVNAYDSVENEPDHFAVSVYDNKEGKVVKSFGTRPHKDYDNPKPQEARDWLAATYPEHRNPFAYWD